VPASAQAPLQLVVVALALGVTGPVQFVRLQRRRRLMEDMPTARIRSAAQGYVELVGTAHAPDTPLLSPITHTPCAWYRYKIERRREQDRSGSNWEVEFKGESDVQFWLDDGSGRCIVDPERAEVRARSRRTWTGATAQVVPGTSGEVTLYGDDDHRYTEELILPGEPTYALGWFTSLSPLQASLHDDVRDRVATWKADPARRRAFDANGDGELDMAEFERLRAEAIAAVEAERGQRAAQPQTHLLCKPPDGRLFLLTTEPQDKLQTRLHWQSWAWLGAGLACLGFGAALLLH